MIEKIYTIPVNDAFNSDCECPLCWLSKKSETDYLDYYLGPSLMEPDTRKITNKTGFCPDHMGKLNKRETSRLGLGLMLHTHLKDIKDNTSPKIADAVPAKCGLLKGRSNDYKNKMRSCADLIDSRINSCPICEKMNYAMDRYIDVIFWQYANEPEFRKKLQDKKYFCLPHISMMLRRGADKLSQNDASEFMTALLTGYDSGLSELIADVEWFTLKFDYRNTDKPWGNSKNALQRSMRFLSADRSDFDEKQPKK